MRGVKYQRGFSLLEVLVFVSIVSLFFIAAAAVATFSLRNLKSNENKILATRYAEELLEWVRGEKEADWEDFTATKTSGSGTSWCFDVVPISGWPDSSCDKIGGLFSRTIVLTLNGTRVNADILVTWSEGSQTFNVPLKTVFERFE